MRHMTRRTLIPALCMATLAACSPAEDDRSPYYSIPGARTGDTAGGGDSDPGTVTCGNGSLDGGEQCDRALALTETCDSLGYASGNLTCSTTCTLNTSGCQVLATCNNGSLDTLEVCEGFELRNQTCQGLGYDSGTLRCTQDCTLDASGCTECGNDFQEGSELCDGDDLGGATCATEVGAGYVGTLTCNSSCSSISTTGCSLPTPRDGSCAQPGTQDTCNTGMTCDIVYADSNGAAAACKLRCASTAIGSSGGCPGGEQCLNSNWLDIQVDAGDNRVTCSNPGTVDNCNSGQGFACREISDGSNVCSKAVAWCGTPVDWVTDYTDNNSILASPTCNTISNHLMCAAPASPSGEPAAVQCLVTEDNGDGICIAMCEDSDGNTLSCGTGYSCQEPATAVYYASEDNGGGGSISCSDDGPCNTGAGYSCVQLGSMICARPLHVCMGD